MNIVEHIMAVLEFLIEEASRTIIGLSTTAIVGGIVWLATIRYRNQKLKLLLGNPARIFILYYRGDEDTTFRKQLTFNVDSSVNDGKHPNECYWNISMGLLGLHTDAKKIYSKFRWDQKVGRLIHTNDPKLPSVMGQYIVPLFIPAWDNKNIYLETLRLRETVTHNPLWRD